MKTTLLLLAITALTSSCVHVQDPHSTPGNKIWVPLPTYFNDRLLTV